MTPEGEKLIACLFKKISTRPEVVGVIIRFNEQSKCAELGTGYKIISSASSLFFTVYKPAFYFKIRIKWIEGRDNMPNLVVLVILTYPKNYYALELIKWLRHLMHQPPFRSYEKEVYVLLWSWSGRTVKPYTISYRYFLSSSILR